MAGNKVVYMFTALALSTVQSTDLRVSQLNG
jgi:hypothetical protein